MIISVWKGETQSRDAVTVTIGEDEGQCDRVSLIRSGWLESVTDHSPHTAGGFYRGLFLCWRESEAGRVLLNVRPMYLGDSPWFSHLLSFEREALEACGFTCGDEAEGRGFTLSEGM